MTAGYSTVLWIRCGMMIMNYRFGNTEEGVHTLWNYIHIGLKPRLPLQKQHSALFTSKLKLNFRKELVM
jgi:hypothetical protein